jgi:hypothetical protein
VDVAREHQVDGSGKEFERDFKKIAKPKAHKSSRYKSR